MEELQAGSVLVSRNAIEANNTSPGYWNHLGMATGTGFIIEAQENRGVIRTPTNEYFARGYTVVVLKPRDAAQGRAAAKVANGFVGEKYSLMASVGLQGPKQALKLGHNCVSIVRRAEEQITGKHYPEFIEPDDVFKLREILAQ